MTEGLDTKTTKTTKITKARFARCHLITAPEGLAAALRAALVVFVVLVSKDLT